ncbi:LemA family protein [Candidatus Saccharibacteria bacterium]|nr:LemA family protein [Candidatus Saccharibacteria bacterium]MCB9821724.1 LemA family protein [Candidatus Nomurabacteria bacterium]
MPIIVVVLIVVVVLGLALGTMYNGLVRARNRVDEAWSDITVQLKRRYDLIPNLIETVKGYAKHEKETLDAVVSARNQAMGAHGTADQAKAENMLEGTLKNLFALSESYPDLKANQNFIQLQNELVDTEDKIQASRRLYNGSARGYNDKTQSFPTNILAGMFGFKGNREYFEVEDRAAVEAPVEVKF